MAEPGAQLDLDPVLDELIDWRFKSFPMPAEPVPIRRVPSQAWNVLGGESVLPTLVLKDRALRHNIDLMAKHTGAALLKGRRAWRLLTTSRA